MPLLMADRGQELVPTKTMEFQLKLKLKLELKLKLVGISPKRLIAGRPRFIDLALTLAGEACHMISRDVAQTTQLHFRLNCSNIIQLSEVHQS
ncbi:hypothetical protein ACLKA6_018256 [Drosophila palustris]